MNGKLTIDFLSDTCFSMPAGLDISVDTDVSMDALGLPMIPGKTLHGLLRDTWLSMRAQLDKAELGYTLLGVPRSHLVEGVMRIGDAHLPTTIWNQVQRAQKRENRPLHRSALRDAFLTTRTLTAQERATGAPKTETLRVVRVVPAGTILLAPIQTLEPLDLDQTRLLDLLCNLTRHVGIHRNRGLGHVRISMDWDETDTRPDLTDLKYPIDAESIFLHYRMILTAPCLVGGEEIDPNSRVTRDYISGSAVRGAIAAALVREKAADLHEIVVSGKVRFLNAYPESEERRALPTPITWQKNKMALYEDISPRVEPCDALMELFGPNRASTSLWKEQRQPVKGRFWSYRSGHFLAQPARRYSTHQSRERETGITRKDGDSTVFVYEALESGQAFRGCIAAPANDQALLLRLTQLLAEKPLWLGRSARSGYGGVPLVALLKSAQANAGIGQLHPMTQETDPDFPLPRNIEAERYFEVRLTSDAVLRDPDTGQFDPWRLQTELQTRFDAVADVETACVVANRAHSFNRLWRTEIPVVPCAGAGSVALLKARVDIGQATLLKLQALPIGERTTEGNGCFVITMTDDEPLSLNPPHTNTVAREASEPMDLLAKAQERLYTVRMRQLLGNKAVQDAETASNLPSASLLQRLRIPLRASEGWATTYQAWLAGPVSGRLRDRALNPLKETRIAKTNLAHYLTSAAATNWVPDLGRAEEERYREENRMVAEALSIQQWNAVKADLKVYYLDILLGALAKRARKQRGEDND